MSHNLKTPLNGIIMLANLCKVEKNPNQLDRHIEDIHKNGILLLNMIE